MTIRPALLSDAEAICTLWNLHIRERLTTFNSTPKTPDSVAGQIAQSRAEGFGFWVIDEGEGLLGFAYYAQFRGGIGYAHALEHTIYMADGAAGRGLGRGLLGAVETYARAKGGHVMMAGVSAENAVGIAFHARCGYAQVARIAEVGRKFDHWLDLILMQKFLILSTFLLHLTFHHLSYPAIPILRML